MKLVVYIVTPVSAELIHTLHKYSYMRHCVNMQTYIYIFISHTIL